MEEQEIAEFEEEKYSDEQKSESQQSESDFEVNIENEEDIQESPVNTRTIQK